MSTLACLGGKPITKNMVGNSKFTSRADLERKYLIQTYESGIWDDWPGKDSMASLFQQEWADFNDSKYCVLLTNGTHTLQLALEALDIGVDDEVIVPGLTWQATASAVCDVNAVPVLVDVDPETLCIDPQKIEENVTEKTRAIIPVHIYHRMADMDRILPLARKHNLWVIEDCAHTHGSRWDDRGAGSLGDFGSFSFQMSKLMTAGEGGSLLMQDEDLYWKVVSQRVCGREIKEGIRVHSGNYRITSFQAAILRGQLAAMRENAALIDQNGLALDRAVANAPGVRPLRRSEHITRQCGYAFVFLYDKEAYDNLSAEKFRKALSVELGRKFESTYTPLHHSEVYFPHTKKRHQLSETYLKAINPSRWNLPVCDRLWGDQSIISSWDIYACPPNRAGLLTEAIGKIYDNHKELLAIKD